MLVLPLGFWSDNEVLGKQVTIAVKTGARRKEGDIKVHISRPGTGVKCLLFVSRRNGQLGTRTTTTITNNKDTPAPPAAPPPPTPVKGIRSVVSRRH